MKYNLYILFILLIPYSIQAQKTVWAIPFTHDISLVSSLHKVCTDSEDNFYVMANFARKISFGTIELKSGAKSPDITDAFVAKIDPEGESIFWGIQITSLGNVVGKGITTDNKNNLYITGSFEGETSFGSITISPKKRFGFFIAKFNSNGEVEWVKQGGNYDTKYGMSTTYGFAIETDNKGNVYTAVNILGMYDDWVLDSSLPIENQYLGKAYYEDQAIEGDEFYTGNHTVLFKLSTNGDFIWKKAGAMNLNLQDLALDADGNAYLTGGIGGSTIFEGKKLESNGLSDIVVIKFYNDGKTAWMKQYGTGKPYTSGAYATKLPTDVEGGQFISTDEEGSIYFTGVHFDGARFDDKTLPSQANIKGLEVGNAFLAKINKDGQIQWIKNAKGKGTAGISGMVCDQNGNIYISGIIGFKKVTFDGHKAKGPFIMKFNANGDLQWIDDADTREKSWGKTVKVRVSYISSIAISNSADFLYTTGNAMKETKETSYGYKTITTTTTETMMAISKIKTD